MNLRPIIASSLKRAFNASSRLPAASAYIFAVAADKGFSLLTMPLMAHELTPASFGQLDVAVSVLEFIGILATLGLAETCIRFTAGDGAGCSRRAEIASEFLGAGVLSAVLLGVAVQVFLRPIADWIGVSVDPIALRVAAAGVCAAGLIELPLVWLRLDGRGWRFFAFVGVRATVQAAATVTVLLAGGKAASLLIANAIIALGFAATLVAFQIRETGIRFSLAPLPLMARYGLPLVGGLVAMFALGNCDRWFLAGHVPASEIAYYGLAAKLGLITAVLYQPFLLWWIARRLAILSGQGPAKLALAWGQGVGLLIFSGLAVALIAPAFICVAFPGAYRKAIEYIPLLVLISVLNELCTLTNTGVYATSHGFRVLAVNAAGAAAAIAGYALLVPSQGVPGAIEATIAAHLVRLGLFVRLGRGAAPAPYPWASAGIAASLAALSVMFAPPAADLVLRTAWLAASGLLLAGALLSLGLVALPGAVEKKLPRLPFRMFARNG